jgi:hypothetical protein
LWRKVQQEGSISRPKWKTIDQINHSIAQTEPNPLTTSKNRKKKKKRNGRRWVIKLGCNIDGNLDDTKFSEPMPWIGIYVAAASLACLVAMAADAIQGIRNRKFWFPCKFSSGNATSLMTWLAVAIKLSVGLNTSMPRRQDQLAKLSSTFFICTVMGNSMPSLGTMENKEMFMNIMALGILVITVPTPTEIICITITKKCCNFSGSHAWIILYALVI